MVIAGNSRLLMPNVPITLWYATPSLSYPDYALSFAVSQFQYCLNPSLIPNELLSLFCFCFSSVVYLFKALWFELLWLRLELGEDSNTSLVNKFSFYRKVALGTFHDVNSGWLVAAECDCWCQNVWWKEQDFWSKPYQSNGSFSASLCMLKLPKPTELQRITNFWNGECHVGVYSMQKK